MDKNTILAIVLSVIVITVGMTVQTMFFAPEENIPINETSEVLQSFEEEKKQLIFSKKTNLEAEEFVISNEVMDITFDTAGASVSSIILKEISGDIEILIKDEADRNAFLLYPENDLENPITDTFNYKIEDKGDLTTISFDQNFIYDEKEVKVTKRYAVSNKDEYLFQIAVDFKTLNGEELPFNYYTLGYDPQIGPHFGDISNSKYDFRNSYYVEQGENKKVLIKKNESIVKISDPLEWAATAGKYFTVIGSLEGGLDYETTFVKKQNDEGISQSNSIYFTRHSISSPAITDIYTFYCGPKVAASLNKYEIAADNVFGIKNLELTPILDTSSWLGWLENILKMCLNMFYSLIPNYGVAIILLTILIKLLIHPLSKKGMDSTAKMSALNPKLEEIKTKYKDDQQQLNIAMAKLYKEEGINPMGSCLPMLLQFPIFIALYGLLNNHYELRGAMFIPGWITDLSIPETIFNLPFNLPFLGNEIHLLPIIYTTSMIFSMKYTSSTNAQAGGQKGMMYFMMYGMPIMFFFVLYNSPSGLLLYWTVMNSISILQQIYVNKKKGVKYKLEIAEKDAVKAASAKNKKRR